MPDEQNQPATEVTQAVADSNAAAVASLSTLISGTEPSSGVVFASADLVPLSTSASTSQEAPATLGESVQSSGAPMQLPDPSGFEASGYAPGVAESGSSATFAATAQESGLTSKQGAGGAAAGEIVADPAAAELNAISDMTSAENAASGAIQGAVDAPAVAQPGEPVASGSGNSEQPSTSDASATLSTAASTSSAEASAFSTSDTTNTAASSSNASIPVNSAADATMADVGEQAEQQPGTEHPAKPHIRGFLRKIEAGEAIVLADVEAVLRRLEEVL